MSGDLSLMEVMAGGAVLALVLGMIAHRLRVPPLAGFVLAGVMLAPATPGPSISPVHAGLLADVGLVLLMLGIGLRAPWRALWPLDRAAVAGACARLGGGLAFGGLMGIGFGWSPATSMVFGACLAPASLVATRRLLGNRLCGSAGRFTANVAMIETLVCVAAAAVLPAVVGPAGGSAILPGMPLAIGALLVGAALGVDAAMRRTVEQMLPFMDAFAVPFFVALGMQFNWEAIAQMPVAFGATVLFVLVAKAVLLHPCAARAGLRCGPAVMAAGGLAQIGESSWMLVLTGVGTGLLDADAQALVLNAAAASTLVAALRARTWATPGAADVESGAA
ncbi:hypothetical protein FHP25_27250 [Vineibacter terrae]|uniref:Cation/H+ exchanger transmembrane domain-containing protein n=2 Tax=Vineibacter terrae TaxID=2586908 RepID=A0A5C8PF35_9HYPH|nr:hypothetical protein FHP25_27250 [Vineibacter terrae]